jgi:hypothetical protein
MIGGTNANYTLNNTVIFATNSYSPTNQVPMVALPVVFTTSTANTGITGLVYGTTYYVIPINSSAFGLASTSTGAVAGFGELPVVSSSAIPGTFIAFGSTQTRTTPDFFVLTSNPFVGSPAGSWQVSNNGITWDTFVSSPTVNLPVSGVNHAAADFGTVNFSWIRFNFSTAPTSGGLNLQVLINGKNSSR